jgi:hypothetical protein
MSRRELIEWIVMLVIVVAWWPRIFMGYDPLWYHILIYYVSPVVLVVIFINRYRNMQAGFQYSEDMMQSEAGQPDQEAGESQGGEDAEAADSQPRAEQARASLPWMQNSEDSSDES